MKYKTLKRILPAALAVSMLVPQSVLAAPKTAETVEELEIEEEIVEGDAPVEEVETGAAEQPETEESEQQETEESEQPETPVEQVETQEESASEVLYTEESEEEILPEQQIVTPPAAESTFRFMKIEKEYAISRKKDLVHL